MTLLEATGKFVINRIFSISLNLFKFNTSRFKTALYWIQKDLVNNKVLKQKTQKSLRIGSFV